MAKKGEEGKEGPKGKADARGTHARPWRAWLFGAAGVLLLAAAGGLLWIARSPEAPVEAGGWSLARGELALAGGGAGDGGAAGGAAGTPLLAVGSTIDPGRYEARTGARLERAGASIQAAAGTVLEVPVEVGLPRVLSGSCEAELVGPLLLSGVALVPLGAVKVVLDPGGIAVVSGRLRSGGRLVAEGERLDASGRPWPAPAATEAPADLGTPQAEGRARTGRVFDAATGSGIGGARVLATFFHGGEAPTSGIDASALPRAGFERAVDLEGAAAVPSLGSVEVETDAGGSFEIEAFEPSDPRILVHLEVEAEGFAPATAFLSGREGVTGRWEEVEVALRRTAVAEVLVLDPEGRPVPGAPVRVAAWAEGYDFLAPPGAARSAGGRLVKALEPELRFTDAGGALRVAASSHAWTFEGLHPAWHLHHRSLQGEMRGRVTVVLPVDGPFRLLASPSWVERHRVVDQDGVAARGAEVLLELEGMAPQRLLASEDGWIEVGVMPRPPLDEPIGYRHPRQGTLAVLSPELARRSAPVAFPSLVQDVAVQGRMAGLLRLRTVAAESDGRDGSETPVPVAPEDVQVSLDLTLTRRTAGGEAEYRGALPPPGSTVVVFAAGWLPSEAVVPAWSRGAREVDLGDVLLERGLARTVALSGASAEALQGAVLTVDSRLEGDRPQRYRVGADGRVRVGGLLKGAYILGVEGPRLKPFAGDLVVDEAEDDEPSEVEVLPSDEEEVSVAGRVLAVEPLECPRLCVVEQWWVAGASEPLALPPYPLAPDGAFGSSRRLRGVTAVEVAVISSDELGLEVSRPRGEGPPSFAAGEHVLRPRTRAEVSFEAEGLGRVAPPLRVGLTGEGGVERVARLRVRGRRLYVDGLRPGNYTLRWIGEPEAGPPEDALETFGFTVPRGASRIELLAPRRPREEEAVEVLVTDARGAPVAGAKVVPGAPPEGFEPEEPGVVLAPVRPRGKTEFRIDAPGYLAAHVEVDAGGRVPTKLALQKGVSAAATVLDADGARIDGAVTISWEPLTPGPVRHGSPVLAPVDGGRLKAVGLPPLPLSFTFRLEGTDLALRRELTLAEGDRVTELGELRFEETRSLRGRVLLPDLSPAAGAAVGLVARAEALRLPLREGGLARARYAAKAGPDGTFELDGLPLDLSADLALVAGLHGWTDAVEDPADLELEAHDLALSLETSLLVDVGYKDGGERGGHAFWLEHIRDPADPDSRLELGEVPAGLPGGHLYRGVAPGLYRVRWGLREAYAPLPGLWEEALVVPGEEAVVALRLEGRELRGRASLNGEEVERGWILLTDDPGLPGSARVGRVLDGELVVMDPPDAVRAYAAVVPERKPQPLQNILRGEALPVAVQGYHAALRGGFLRFDYRACSLELRFGPSFMARNPGAVVRFDHYEWVRGRFEPRPAEEPLEEPVLRLELLAPGTKGIMVLNAKGTNVFSSLHDLKKDEVVVVP
ncbi:MAG: hypothetical protein HY721_35630 [Planctomycetes bacterium]|nr:hypothetical protein [Planctomycetota bacterium]